MDHLEVNHADGMSAEVEYMTRLGAPVYRVITRDIDANRVIAVRFFPRDMFDAAKKYAHEMVFGPEAVGDIISVRVM